MTKLTFSIAGGLVVAACLLFSVPGCGKAPTSTELEGPSSPSPAAEDPVIISQREIRAQVRRYLHASKDSFYKEELACITFLNLTGPEVTDLSDLTLLPALEELTLDQAAVTDYSVLAQLPALEYLSLRNVEGGALSTLPALPGLKELSITGTALSSLSFLEGYTGLEALSLTLASGNPVKDALSLGKCTALTSLRLTLSTPQKDSTALINAIAGLADLAELSFTFSPGTDGGCSYAPLDGLHHLTRLSLSVPSNAALSTLPKLDTLLELSILGNGTGPTALTPVVESCPALMALTLKNTGVVTLQSLTSLNTLTALTLLDNETLISFDPLASLPNLVRVGYRGHHGRATVSALSLLLPEAYVYLVDPAA